VYLIHHPLHVLQTPLDIGGDRLSTGFEVA